MENILKTKTIQELLQLKEDCDDIYYNTGQTSRLSDDEYDLLCDYLEKNHQKIEVGSNVTNIKKKIKLPVWLGSMDKIAHDDPERKLSNWKKRNDYNNEFIIEEKLDGVSCLVVYHENKINLYTRGNGKIGTDISHLKSYFKNIPVKNVPKNTKVRGELIISKSDFETKYKNTFANARNLVSGCINAKTIKNGVTDIQFVAYELISDDIVKPSVQLEILNTYGFNTIHSRILSDVTVDLLKSTLITIKNESPYEIDGIIVQHNKVYTRNTNGNPSYAFAFKIMNFENIEKTVVECVEWNISKWGQIKPRLQIEPVKIGGSIISYVSAHNAKFIKDNNIGKGTVLNITRSGDVIPYIVNIVSSTQADLPTDIEYIWNDTQTDIMTTNETNEQKIKHIYNFFKSINVKYLGIQNIRKIYNNGFDTIHKILNISINELKLIDGFKTKMAENIYNSIHTYIRESNIVDVLSASGVFGFGLGEKKIRTMFDKIPNAMRMSKEDIRRVLLETNGFSDKTVDKIISNMETAKTFYDSIKSYIRTDVINKNTTTLINEYTNENVVFSGFRDKDLEDFIKRSGGKVSNSITRKTTLLLVKSDKQTDKYNKAIEYEIKIKQI